MQPDTRKPKATHTKKKDLTALFLNLPWEMRKGHQMSVNAPSPVLQTPVLDCLGLMPSCADASIPQAELVLHSCHCTAQ